MKSRHWHVKEKVGAFGDKELACKGASQNWGEGCKLPSSYLMQSWFLSRKICYIVIMYFTVGFLSH